MKTMKKESSSKSMTKAKHGIKVNDKKTDRKNKRAEKKINKPKPWVEKISGSDLKKIQSMPKVDVKTLNPCSGGNCRPSVKSKGGTVKKASVGMITESSSTPKPGTAIIETLVEYAKNLEFGTSKFRARHHFRNSARRNEKKIIDFVAKKIKAVI